MDALLFSLKTWFLAWTVWFGLLFLVWLSIVVYQVSTSYYQ